MRVLHVIGHLNLAGAERLVADLAPRLRDTGIETDVYVLEVEQTDLYERLVGAGIRVFRGNGLSFYNPVQILCLRAHFSRHSYDIVHVHLFPAILWVPLALLVCPRRPTLITTEHNTRNGRRHVWFRSVDQFCYAQYSAVACITQETLDALVEWLPETASKVVVIENGVDLSRFNSGGKVAREDVYLTGRKVVLSIGRLTEQKGFDILIRAIAQTPGVHLTIVGEGPLRSEMQKLIDDLNLRDRVDLPGISTNIEQFLKAADLYVQPSLWEGFGIAAVEAMAAGLPVIVSDVPGLSQVVGEAGRKFPAGDTGALSELIRTFLGDELLAGQYATRSRDRSEAYSIAKTVGKYCQLYTSLIEIDQRGSSSAARPLAS